MQQAAVAADGAHPSPAPEALFEASRPDTGVQAPLDQPRIEYRPPGALHDRVSTNRDRPSRNPLSDIKNMLQSAPARNGQDHAAAMVEAAEARDENVAPVVLSAAARNVQEDVVVRPASARPTSAAPVRPMSAMPGAGERPLIQHGELEHAPHQSITQQHCRQEP